LKPKNKTPL